jgi:uracil-DNA glycosylase family 4
VTCASCPRIRRPVLSSGPRPCRLLLLSECPSTNDDKFNRPLSGQAGQELDNTYLPLLNLPRSEIFVTNARLCSHSDYHLPTTQEVEDCCAVHLSQTLNEVKPQVIMPMGAVACSVFGISSLVMEHGLPRVGKWGAWEGVVFPTYHPTLGMKSTSMMIPLMSDFHVLGKLLADLDSKGFRYRA